MLSRKFSKRPCRVQARSDCHASNGRRRRAIAARCNQARSFSSAHYAVAANGAIHQYVEETDTAFHAGVVVNPTWALLKPGKNPNLYTVAIEMEGSSGAEIGKAQYDAAADLIAEIASRWDFPPDSDHVVLHSEIRAGRECPDNGFDRKAVLDRIGSAVQLGPEASSESEVRILKDAKVREGAPGTNVRVVRVAPASTVETVYGFTDQGERLQGNSYWYRLGDGNYLWAGATDAPNPLSPRRPEPVALPAFVAQLEARAAQSGIERIDGLFKAAGAAAITATDADRAAIGAVQDLLTGLGFAGLPSLFSSGYGIFGQKTDEAIRAFQGRNTLPSSGSVDGATLQKMIASPAPDPRAVQVYLTLVLGFPFTGMHRVLSLVAQMEGVGKFAALNRNTDRAGLSFGLIQWAQKPGRLCEVLAAMSSADRDRFVKTFGEGDASVADALVAYCRKPHGGVTRRRENRRTPRSILRPTVARQVPAGRASRYISAGPSPDRPDGVSKVVRQCPTVCAGVAFRTWGRIHARCRQSVWGCRRRTALPDLQPSWLGGNGCACGNCRGHSRPRGRPVQDECSDAT